MVKGGLLWFHHVLIAAVDVANSYQVSFRSTFIYRVQQCSSTLADPAVLP